MNNEQTADKEYPMPRSIRIPEPQQTQIAEMAQWRSTKVATEIQAAIREYIKNHYKEFKKEFEDLRHE